MKIGGMAGSYGSVIQNSPKQWRKIFSKTLAKDQKSEYTKDVEKNKRQCVNTTVWVETNLTVGYLFRVFAEKITRLSYQN